MNDKTINVFTSDGLAVFKTKMFQHANWVIQLAKQMNSQGIIFWDLEGEQYPQGVSTYAGDPRLLSRLAPEMDAIADQLLSAFTTQGLRVGLTIRAQQIVFRPDGSFFQRGWPVGNDDAVFADLDSKINYAITRWGASIFYIDSNSWPRAWYANSEYFAIQSLYKQVTSSPKPIVFPNDYQATAGALNVYNATSNGFVLGNPNGSLKILSTTSPHNGGTATVQNNQLLYSAPNTSGVEDSVTITVTDGNSVTTVPIGLKTAAGTPEPAP